MNKTAETADNTDAANLEPILAALGKRVAKKELAEAKAFVGAFYQRMDVEEIRQHSAESWAELAADMLEFVRTRKRGKSNVQLLNPAVKAEGPESAHTVLQIVNDDMPFLVDSVALALTEYFDIPPENMVVQGYGETELLIDTQESEAANRRVEVRVITPLLRRADRG